MIRQQAGWKKKAINIRSMRALAGKALPQPVFDFADGAAEDEQALRRNEGAFEDFHLVPRPLRGAAERDQSVTLFGQKISMPVFVGPTGLAGLFWPDGERCTARAAAAAGTGQCLSHGSVCTLEEFAATGVSPRWMQVFIYKDRGFTRELTERAAAANYDALVLTIDNQLLGNRERDLRNGFTIPPSFGVSGVARMVTKAPYLWRMRNEFRRITFGNYVREGDTSDIAALAARMGEILDPAMSWDDVADLRKVWKGPFILKGILHPGDIETAVDHGVDGVVVSNHGGRQLDSAPGTIDVLRQIVGAVDGRMTVLLDGGVRRGSDVVKALALGAAACLIGRPQLWGLAVAGEAGVAHMLEIYRREIDLVMGLCGVTSISQIGRDLLLDMNRT